MKIIIENRSSKSDQRAIEAVSMVIAEGRISGGGKQYCYYAITGDGLGIASFLNKNSDRFVVSDDKTLTTIKES